MPIPNLNAHGLLPAGVHDCTLMEIEAVFAWNAHRRRMYRDFALCFKDELRPRFTVPILVDGSFVTDAEAPNDVDAVLDAMQASREEQKLCLKLWSFHRRPLMSNYGVELWLDLPGRESMALLFQRLKARDAKFRNLDEHHRKGILRIA